MYEYIKLTPDEATTLTHFTEELRESTVTFEPAVTTFYQIISGLQNCNNILGLCGMQLLSESVMLFRGDHVFCKFRGKKIHGDSIKFRLNQVEENFPYVKTVLAYTNKTSTTNYLKAGFKIQAKLNKYQVLVSKEINQ